MGIGAILLVLLLVFILLRCLGSGGGLIPDPGAVEGSSTWAAVAGTHWRSTRRIRRALADAVGDDLQIMWDETFREAGRTYEDTQIVLFRGSTQTGCGLGSAQTGAFCPLDRRVYIDPVLPGARAAVRGGRRLRAGLRDRARDGDHIQTLGISRQVQQASQQDPSIANELSVRQELQADCLAGVWAHSANARGALELGDLERSTPPSRSATTASSRRHRDASIPSRGRTARPCSGSAGCGRGSRRGTWRRATRSPWTSKSSDRELSLTRRPQEGR